MKVKPVILIIGLIIGLYLLFRKKQVQEPTMDNLESAVIENNGAGLEFTSASVNTPVQTTEDLKPPIHYPEVTSGITEGVLSDPIPYIDYGGHPLSSGSGDQVSVLSQFEIT